MLKAGYCEECKKNVWLRETGGCINEHDSNSIGRVLRPEKTLGLYAWISFFSMCLLFSLGVYAHFILFDNWIPFNDPRTQWLILGILAVLSGSELAFESFMRRVAEKKVAPANIRKTEFGSALGLLVLIVSSPPMQASFSFGVLLFTGKVTFAIALFMLGVILIIYNIRWSQDLFESSSFRAL